METQALQCAPSGLGAQTAIDFAYDDWKEADAAARVLLRKVRDAWSRYDRGAGYPPSRDLLLEASSLRQQAGAKLAYAIDLLHQQGAIQPAAGAGSGR